MIMDIVAGLILLYFSIQGFRRGLITEVFLLAALILCIVSSAQITSWMLQYMPDWEKRTKTLVALCSGSVLVILFFYIISRLITLFLKITALNIFNRLAGFFFGLVKGILILVLLIFFIETTLKRPIQQDPKSRLYKPIGIISKKVSPVIVPAGLVSY